MSCVTLAQSHKVHGRSGEEALKYLGMWILLGISSFLVCEIIAGYQYNVEDGEMGGDETDTAAVTGMHDGPQTLSHVQVSRASERHEKCHLRI